MPDIKTNALDISAAEEILAYKHRVLIKSFKEADIIKKSLVIRLAIKYAELGLLRLIMFCMMLASKKIVAKLDWTKRKGCDIGYEEEKSTNKIRVAVVLNGGIGDLVNSSTFLTALYEHYDLPPADIFYPRVESINYAFNRANFKNKLFPSSVFDALKKNYDIIIRIQDCCTFILRMSEKLVREYSDLLEAISKCQEESVHFERYITYHPMLDGHCADELIVRGFTRLTAPGMVLNLPIDETKHCKIYPSLPADNYLQKIGLDAPYITIHDGFDNEVPVVGQCSTKQWSVPAWEALVLMIKSEFTQLKVVQLGSKNSRIIKGIDKCVVGDTSLEQATLILSNSCLHVDSESGLVRVAKAYGVKSVVLFGPTNPKYYGFKSNLNIFPNECGNCAFSTPDWMSKCPRGFATPKCMDSILPEQVFHKIKNELMAVFATTSCTLVTDRAVN